MVHLSILVPDSQANLSTFACITGALQLFGEAEILRSRAGLPELFNVELVGATHTSLETNGISVRPSVSIGDIEQTGLIIIPASLIRNYESATSNNRLLIDWVARQYRQGAEVASLCAGGFTLAAAGLLSGRSCSTHWALADRFRESFPEVSLQRDCLITDENGIYTNGGAYSFLHLLMYLVEKFYGRPTAIHCAKYFQIDLDRHSQAGFSIFSGHKKHGDGIVLEAQLFIERHYTEKISFEKLASKLGAGRRTFDRRFIKATGLTPLDYLQRVRIEHAKKSFETTRKTVNEIMYEAGYSDAKAFRDVFNRVTGVLPLAYRSKYNREVSVVSERKFV